MPIKIVKTNENTQFVGHFNGEADLLIQSGVFTNDEVGIKIMEIKGEHKIGEEVPDADIKEDIPDIVLPFQEKESIDILIKQLEYSKELLDRLEEREDKDGR